MYESNKESNKPNNPIVGKVDIDGNNIGDSNSVVSSDMDSGIPSGDVCGSTIPDGEVPVPKRKAGRPKITPNDDFLSMKTIAASEGIPYANLKAAKALKLEGFRPDGKVNWTILKPEYEKNIDKIIDFLNDNADNLKKQKLKEEIEYKKLKNAELKRQKIDIQDINEFMQTLAIQLTGLLNSKVIKELPPQVIGKSEEETRYVCKEMINDIMVILKQNITDWNPTPKL